MKRFHAMQTRMLSAVAALLLVATATASAQWTPVTDVPLTGDYWAFAAAMHDGKVYTLGGVTQSGTALTNAILQYDVLNDEWTPRGNLFAPMYFGAGAIVDGKIYVAGGQTSGANTSFLNGMIVFDPVTGGISAGGALPYPLTSAAAASAGGKLVVMGGLRRRDAQSNTIIQDIHLYTPGGSWLELTGAMPAPLYYAQAVGDGNTIYLAGGANGSGAQTAAYKGTLSGNSITWTPIAALPVPIFGGAMAMLDGRPMIAGGSADGGQSGSTNAYIYNADQDKWEPFYQTPSAAFFGGLVGDGSQVVLVGGQGSVDVHVGTLSESVPVASFGQNRILVSAQAGGSAVQRSIVVGNGGLAELKVTAEVPVDAESWLSASSVDVQPGTTGNITFTIDPSGLAEGVYSSTVTLMHNDESKDPHEVIVSLFVGELPEKQDLNVVIEEASGDWCGWCPDGQKYLRQLEEQFPDEVIILSYHGGSANEPLAIPAGTQILSMLGTTGFPSAAINRIRFTGEAGLMVNRGTWTPYTEAVLGAFDRAPATLTIDEYEFNPETRTVTATVTVTTADWLPVSMSYAVSAVVTQNNIYTSQVDYVDGDHDSYHQAHAVRHVWPGANGSALSMSTTQTVEGYMTPGRTATREISFTIPETSGQAQFEILPEDSHITFVVHTSAAGQPGMILQAQQRELESEFTPGPAISVEWGSSQEKTVSPEQTASFDIKVTNNTSEPTTVTLTRATNSLPSGWMSEICTGTSDCDDADVVTYTIPADGSHTFNLKVYGATAEQTGNVTLVVTSGDVTQQQEFTVNTGASGVKVAGERNGLSLASVTPNPASTLARVEVTIPVAAETTLEVYTTAGEKVATLFQGRLESGTRQINADVTGLESGKYVLVLTSGETKVSRTLTVIR